MGGRSVRRKASVLLIGFLERVNTLQIPGTTLVISRTATWVLQANAYSVRIWRTDFTHELVQDIHATQRDPQTISCLEAKLKVQIDR